MTYVQVDSNGTIIASADWPFPGSEAVSYDVLVYPDGRLYRADNAPALYARPGTSTLQAGGICPDGFVSMQSLPPDADASHLPIAQADGTWLLTTINTDAQLRAEAIVNAHMRSATLQTAAFSTAEFATLAAAHLFDSWQAGASYTAGQRIEHNGVVYEVVQAVTAQSPQPPDAAGMLAVYRPLSVDAETGEEPDGSRDNPYAFISGMDVHTGKYYTYDGKLWLAKADMLPCTWNPGTAGLWQWEEVDVR